MRQQNAMHHPPIALIKFAERCTVAAPCRMYQLRVLGKVSHEVVRWHGSFSDSQPLVKSCNHAKLHRIEDARNDSTVIGLVTTRKCIA
jgi:hypothetical protein